MPEAFPECRALEAYIARPCVPTNEVFQELVAQVWAVASYGALTILENAVEVTVSVLVPHGCSFGMGSPLLKQFLCHLVIAASMVELSLGLSKNRVPKWAARVVRQCEPGSVHEFCLRSPSLVLWLRGLIDGRFEHGAITYTLWNRCAFYIGKTKCVRANGLSGCVEWLSEHLRAFVVESSRDGSKPRYRLLRKSGVRHLRFLPSVWWDTERRALAPESLSIAMERPPCNEIDMKQPYVCRSELSGCACAQKRTRRRRPVAWRRFRQSPLQSLWDNPVCQCALDRKCNTECFLPGGAESLSLPFRLLYAMVLKEQCALLGVVAGPLNIFASMNLFIAWLAVP
eukprot:177345-Amphidinium_carterae.1